MQEVPRRRRITTEEVGDVTIVNFIDKKILDEKNIQMIGEDLNRLVDELGRRKIVIDFRDQKVGAVEFMSSMCLGKFGIPKLG